MMKLALIFLMMLNSLFIQGCITSSDSSVEYEYKNKQIAAEDNVKLGLAYLQESNISHAKEKLLIALQEMPNWTVTQDAMGYFFESTGDKLTAEKYYRQAIRLSPHDGASLNNYGSFLCRDHRAIEAEKLFVQAAALPDYLNTAQAYENAGLCVLPNKNKAKYYFQKALQQDPYREISAKALEKLNE